MHNFCGIILDHMNVKHYPHRSTQCMMFFSQKENEQPTTSYCCHHRAAVTAHGSHTQVLNIVETVNPRATIIRVVEESKPGKRAAMYTGLAYVDTEITVFADDDALYGPAVLKSLIMPFKDPAMGGCGTRQIARPKGDKFCFSDIMMVS